MAFSFKRLLPLFYVFACLLLIKYATARDELYDSSPSKEAKFEALTVSEIEEQLQSCPVVQSLNAQKLASSPQTSSLTSRIFGFLFPGSPATNSLLATLYISGPPNFLLALCPPNIDPSSLSVMVAFAVGGLLGDTLFHLLPEIFLGEDSPTQTRFVLVEPNKNLLLGVAMMIGFVTFVAMDKALRIATGGHGHEHNHPSPNSTTSPNDEKTSTAAASGLETPLSPSTTLRSRNPPSTNPSSNPLPSEPSSTTSPSIKLSAYLNLLADFTHNITDGLALSSSFYSSATTGATTTVAVFMHEIPHEVGDFALLIQSGFSKRAAMGAQFVTAFGAFLGTVIGIAIQEYGGSSSNNNNNNNSNSSNSIGKQGRTSGLLGTSLSIGDLLLPFTAGTFLYVGTVAVIPELLETTDKSSSSGRREEIRKTGKQFLAMAAGAGIMLA